MNSKGGWCGLGVRILGTMAGLAVTAGLSGCMGHGNYTTEHISGAKQKMEAMKAATEWQTARQAFLAGDMTKALKHVEVSISLNNTVVKSHVLRGRIEMEMSNLEEAANSFQRAEALDPKAVDPQYYMGLLYERYTQKDKALEKYLGAAEIEPANPQYALAAAEMMIDLGKLDDAKEYLTTRRSTFEHNAGVRQTLGHIAMMQSETTVALGHFNEAHLLAPEDGGILEDLGRAQFQNGVYADAEFSFSRLVNAPENKDRHDLKLLWANCLIKVDRSIEARELLLGVSRDQSGAADVETWIALGNVCYTLHDLNRVKQASGRVVAMAPNRVEGYLLRALYLRQSGELGGAEASLKQALALQKSADTYTLLGIVQQEQNKLDQARVSFQTAVKLDPASKEAGALLSAAGGE